MYVHARGSGVWRVISLLPGVICRPCEGSTGLEHELDGGGILMHS